MSMYNTFHLCKRILIINNKPCHPSINIVKIIYSIGVILNKCLMSVYYQYDSLFFYFVSNYYSGKIDNLVKVILKISWEGMVIEKIEENKITLEKSGKFLFKISLLINHSLNNFDNRKTLLDNANKYSS